MYTGRKVAENRGDFFIYVEADIRRQFERDLVDVLGDQVGRQLIKVVVYQL